MTCKKCGNGIEIPYLTTTTAAGLPGQPGGPGLPGSSAPTVTNIVINPNNTLTFTYSNGTSFTTASPINFNALETSYVFYHSTPNASNDSFNIPDGTLEADGDYLDIWITGVMDNTPQATDLAYTVDGNENVLIPALYASSLIGGGYFKINLQLLRKDATTVVCNGNFRYTDIELAGLEITNFTTEIDFFSEDTVDFITGFDFSIYQFAAIGGGNPNIEQVTATLFKNN